MSSSSHIPCSLHPELKPRNAIVNSLNKMKVEHVVNREAERIDRVKRENAVKRAATAAGGIPIVSHNQVSTRRCVHGLESR